MGLGTATRLARIFSHESGHLFGVALDHFVGYGNVREGGLADLPAALARVMEAGPDSVTLQLGAAKHLWPAYAGRAALITQGGCFTPDDRVRELITTPADALRLGADALAVAIPVRGVSEGGYLRWLADSVRAAGPLELPVIAHIYPRDFSGSDGPRIVFTPEEIAWAVRCGIETGVDVIKVGYPGDRAAFTEIVASCPVPVVIAGGPKVATLAEALVQVADSLDSGAVGAVVGRNIWGQDDASSAAAAYRHVLHDGLGADDALATAGADRAGLGR